MSVKTYVQIKNPIQAICWTGENLKEIKDFLGDKLIIEDSIFNINRDNKPCMFNYYLYLEFYNKDHIIHLDDYIIKSGNTYTIMDPLTFSLTYKEEENAEE